MKYTVVIRQPVPDEVRPTLEKELVERFGLNEQQAERLAGRRAGRLLKPTTQARADLLLRVYLSVGAQVLLEEIPEDGDAPSQAFRAAPAPVDEAVLAPPLPNDISLSEFSLPVGGSSVGGDVFSPAGAGFTASDDPFAATFAPVGGASPTALLEAPPLPDWATHDPNLLPGHDPGVNLVGGLPGPSLSSTATPSEAAIARELHSAVNGNSAAISTTAAGGASTADGGSRAGSPKGPLTDDWADFAGGLNLPENSAPVTAPRATTEFLTAVTEDAPAKTLPRTSLARQITLATLLPVGLSSLLSLSLLALSLPGQQNRTSINSAQNLATAIGTTLNDSFQALTDEQLDAIVTNPEVGFVRVESANGTSYTRTKDPLKNDAVNKQLAAWSQSNPNGHKVNLDSGTYVTSRVTFVNQDGRITPVQGAIPANATLVRRVSVGIIDSQSQRILWNILLLSILATLIGLGIASLLARQAAQRIVQPISDLVKVADAISLGDLTRPVKATSNDELGDLSQALERMRLSLEAAMDRLRRRKRG
ncbi:HAMP domain-containing protein [Deinococcus fonticola]|uniref:HAMP domain-containing protein n=1 Tax=Deinococcus fonticola TaxID=2528713 RepID=UPI00107574E9|nr:HAMP domain-containing protein [Deinococcus fonticola]